MLMQYGWDERDFAAIAEAADMEEIVDFFENEVRDDYLFIVWYSTTTKKWLATDRGSLAMAEISGYLSDLLPDLYPNILTDLPRYEEFYPLVDQRLQEIIEKAEGQPAEDPGDSQIIEWLVDAGVLLEDNMPEPCHHSWSAMAICSHCEKIYCSECHDECCEKTFSTIA
jgi:hypothetical protein